MTIFVDPMDQDPNIPGGDHCPDHPNEQLEAGYGLAGGGMGLYMYCPICGNIIDKVQDKPHDTP